MRKKTLIAQMILVCIVPLLSAQVVPFQFQNLSPFPLSVNQLLGNEGLTGTNLRAPLGPGFQFVSTPGNIIQNLGLDQLGQNFGLPESLISSSQIGSGGQIEQRVQNLPFQLQQPSVARETQFNVNNVQTMTRVQNTQWRGIILYHQVPNNFNLNEYYRFHGKVNDYQIFAQALRNAPPGYNLINVVFQDAFRNTTIKCYDFINEVTSEFEVTCKLNITGSFYISIFAGLYGQSNSRMRNIVNQNFNEGSPIIRQSQNLNYEIDNNILYIVLDPSAVTVLTFQQNQRQIRYILSNFWNKFKIPFEDFFDFDLGITNISINRMNSPDGSFYSRDINQSEIIQTSFNACEHKYSQINDPTLMVTGQIPWSVVQSDIVQVQASFSLGIRDEGYLVDPNLRLEKFPILPQDSGIGQFPPILPQQQIAPNKSVRFAIYFEKLGSNLITVYATSGLALLNRPIYVGSKMLPILPDFNDLKQSQSSLSYSEYLHRYLQKSLSIMIPEQPQRNDSLESKKQYMLFLLNTQRSKFNLQQLYTSQLLQEVAQRHATDMSQNNYFSHTDLQGNSVGQRVQRLSRGQSQGVFGENLALSAGLAEGHLSLERSPAHLENSLSQVWTRVGVGIAEDARGAYIVVYVFGSRDLLTEPLSQVEISQFQKTLIDLAMERNPLIVENQALSQTLFNYLQIEREGGQSLAQYLSVNNIRSAYSWTSFQTNYHPNWIQFLREKEQFLKTDGAYRQVGIGIKIDGNGMIKGYALFM